MRISFLFVVAMLLLFASCGKENIVLETNDNVAVQGKKVYDPKTAIDICTPPTVYSKEQLASALTAYGQCKQSQPHLPLVCGEATGAADLYECKQPAYPDQFPMSGLEVISIYNQITSCNSIIDYCAEGSPRYNFYFQAYEATGAICEYFVTIGYYEMECCTVRPPAD